MSLLIEKSIKDFNGGFVWKEGKLSYRWRGKLFTFDFLTKKLAYRLSKLSYKKELLARAIGFKRLKGPVLDLTAGFGVDSFILANLGVEVMMVERSKTIYLLLKDGLRRAKQIPRFANLKLRLVWDESVHFLNGMREQYSVIYLDPMYPLVSSKTALNCERMRFLRVVASGNENNEEALLESALIKATGRVVVKRPIHSDCLGGREPSLQFLGTSCRYDVYFVPCSSLPKNKQK